MTTPTDWLLRVGDGNNFIASSNYKIWGIQTKTSPHGKYFIKNVNPGDRMWFITNKSQGKIIGVATYLSHHKRELGPLLDISMTNEELGWTNNGPDWTSDIEVYYTNLYRLDDFELLTHIKGPTTIRKYEERCKVDLVTEYSNIVRYLFCN